MKKWLISSLLALVLMLAACGEGDPVDPNEMNDLNDGGIEQEDPTDDLGDVVDEDMDSDAE